MRATSWVRARSSRTRIWVLVRPSFFALFDSQVLIGEGGDLRQVGDAENLLGAAEGFEFLADSFGGAASDADVDFVEDQRARRGFLFLVLLTWMYLFNCDFKCQQNAATARRRRRFRSAA